MGHGETFSLQLESLHMAFIPLISDHTHCHGSLRYNGGILTQKIYSVAYIHTGKPFVDGRENERQIKIRITDYAKVCTNFVSIFQMFSL
jgi:hypothetical protein